MIDTLNSFSYYLDQTEITVLDLQLYEKKMKDQALLDTFYVANEYCLIYIEKGNGNHWIDFTIHPFSDQQFILIKKNQLHRFDFSNHPQGKLILYTQKFIDRVNSAINTSCLSHIRFSADIKPVFRINDENLEFYQSLLKELAIETSSNSDDNLLKVLIFSTLIRKIFREEYPVQKLPLLDSGRESLREFITLLERHHAETRDAQNYAEMLDISYAALNEVCKNHSKLTAKQFIDNYIVLEAKRLLFNLDLSQKSIAEMLGFNELTNFRKYFKRHTEMSPNQFRECHRF